MHQAPRQHHAHRPQPRHMQQRTSAARKEVGQARGWLAALVTERAVPEQLKLVTRGDSPAHYQFRLQVASGDVGVAIGECVAAAGTPALARGAIEVFRGRAGGKPGERLVLLRPLTPAELRWPAVRWQGKLKAALALLREWCWHTGSSTLLWLAMQFTLADAIAKQELKTAARDFGEKLSGMPGQVVKVGELLAWSPQLDALAGSLVEVLEQRRNSNPLRDELNARTIQKLLALGQAELAPEILKRFTQLHKLQIKIGALGERRAILDERSRLPLNARDATAVRQIEGMYDRDEGLPLPELRRKFASQQHVIHWLLDAGRLVATAEGYIFTRQQLRQYLSKLPAPRVKNGTIGVREIKDTLGLNRHAAEALRAHLVAEYGRPEDGVAVRHRGRGE